MKDGTAAAFGREIEPLVRMSDLREYRDGLARHLSGEWDDERWTAYRVRFGVYGQKQPGVQMVRVKIPGGIVNVPWLKAVARVNRAFCQGDAHITTRQDFQLYSVPLAKTADMLEALYAEGLTTREACGNTIRNITSCALAGACPREHVDAGAVADRLSRSWLRQPLVQHMPRKVKISVSGCATDCGAASIHDIAFVAIEDAGQKGFAVYAGGGLGSAPRAATKVLDFAFEDDLPAVVEAAARLHHRYSDRANRNASRLKFLVKRFGADRFRDLFREEVERVKGLPQRPWEQLEWRRPEQAAIERTPMGVVRQHDGKAAVVINPPLGLLSSDQLDQLADIAVWAGVAQLRTTRDQTLVFLGVAPEQVEQVVARVRAIGLDVPSRAEDVPDVISCPGTTTCRIGITNSQTFGRQVLAEAEGDETAKGISVRVSGCQNSCGLHHVGDFGFHGMAKKIDGQTAPHYQIHIGGEARANGAVGLAGPIIPAKHAGKALTLLRRGYAAARQADESVRGWAERIGKDGLAEILRPLETAGSEGVFVDWGDSAEFTGAPKERGECAAPFASGELLADLADDALIRADRYLLAARWQEALKAAEEATAFAAHRLLDHLGILVEEQQAGAVVVERLRSAAARDAGVLAALDDVSGHLTAALSNGQADDYREAVAYFIDTVRSRIEAPGLGARAAE